MLRAQKLTAVRRDITRVHLDTLFKFRLANVTMSPYASSGKAKGGELIIQGDLHFVLAMYGHWRPGQQLNLARCHRIPIPRKCTQETLAPLIRAHVCDDSCNRYEYIFEQLASARTDVRHATENEPRNASAGSEDPLRTREQVQPAEPEDGLRDGVDEGGADMSYLDVADDSLKRDIISEWQRVMTNSALEEMVCAVCARRTAQARITFLNPGDVNLEILRNDCLPAHVLPVTYNREVYMGAILHPKGMTRHDTAGALRVCDECRSDLTRSQLPRFALANFLYYGHERLPEEVRNAFRQSTQVERMLVSRARVSKISFRFCELKDHPLEGTDPQTSQRCVRGNLAVHPQDATHLNTVLPPSHDAIRDTICAVFVGKTKPTPKTIEKLRPVLCRKSRLRTIITFLVGSNPAYRVTDQSDYQGFSEANLNELFGQGTEMLDEGVPCAMEVGHIDFSDAVEGATDGYVPGTDSSEVIPGPDDDEMLMENVGYLDSSDSPLNQQEMSMRALSHCLDGKAFVQSQAGSRLIPDFQNPMLLSWLFPHLDPWGIGGFQEPRRLRPLSLEQQLKYLLTVDESPFRDDTDFAFVYYNVCQKKAVFDSVTFRVSASHRERAVNELMAVDKSKLDNMILRFQANPYYKPHEQEEVRIMRLLSQVTTVSHDLPGTTGYKLALRNQIRGLITFEGPPTLFVTINPSDRDHPLVRLYAGHEIDIEDRMRGEELTRWQRSVIVAKNPSACARFFHTMMTNFISVILRHKRRGKGLFGKCRAYYGTVEA